MPPVALHVDGWPPPPLVVAATAMAQTMIWIVVAICVVAIGWSIRELIWLRQMKRRLREIEADIRRFDR